MLALAPRLLKLEAGAPAYETLDFRLEGSFGSVRLHSAYASAGKRDSRVRPQVWCEVLHLPHSSAGAEQERIHVQAARLPYAARRDGWNQARAQSLRTGQGHQVQSRQFLCG